MSTLTIGAIGIGVIILLLFLKMPIGLVLATIGFVGLVYLRSIDVASTIVGIEMVQTIGNYTFITIPMFVLLGSIAANTGISQRAFETANKWIGHFPGGLAMATIAGCAGFSCVCGSSLATAATMCKIAYPPMEKNGYRPILSAASIAAGGTLGILIPPSIPLVLYGIMTETPVGKLLMAGLIPGILLTFLFLLVIFIWVRINPSVGPPLRTTVSMKEKVASLGGTLEIVIVFVLIMGGMFAGLFTATEAAAVGAAGAIVIGVARRLINWRQFSNSISEATITTAMMILLLIGAMIFSRFLAISRLPFEIANAVGGLNITPMGIMIAIMLIYIILGAVMDTASMLFITVPIFAPLVKTLGFDLVWFGIIVVVEMELGMLTPPVGVNVFIISGMLKHVPMWDIFKGVLILATAQIVLLILLLFVPNIALFLPNLMR